ncbi:MAG TPA: serine hydrolase domain-containing protein [Longimicrobiales bacterium]|nr:serine hydrolase domain-containing protein [Longimicrobiales bacterium]
MTGVLRAVPVAALPAVVLTLAGASVAQAQAGRASAGARLAAEADCPAEFAAVLDTVLAVMSAQQLPSVALAAAIHGEVVCETAAGWADRDGEVPATEHTLYSLASISKPFTGTAVMQLVERGLVELDAPANSYLGLAGLRAFEGDADAATVRRLLTHTAGLPLHYQFFYAGGPPVPTMAETIARYGVLVYPPGERYAYANLGYGVLDHIVSRVSEGTYADWMRRQVFEPLGMEDTAVSDGSDLAGLAAVRYANDGSALPPYTFDHVGASGVWSSAYDLVRFGMFQLGQRSPAYSHVLADSLRERMQLSAVVTAPGQARGLGWAITEDDNGYRRVSHTGSMPGVATVLNLYPEAGLAVVVLTNRSHPPSVARVAHTIASVLLPDFAATAAARQAVTAPPARAAAAQAPAADVPADLHGAWRGAVLLHEDRVPLVLVVDAAGGVRARLDAGAEMPLENVRFADGWLTGRLQQTLAPGEATPAEERDRHEVVLNLVLRDGERLAGWASAITVGDPLYGAVSYRMELRRVLP